RGQADAHRRLEARAKPSHGGGSARYDRRTSRRLLMPRRSCFRLLTAVPGLLLATALAGHAAEPNFSGVWKLNHELSDNAEEKVKYAAGSEYMKGRPGIGSETILPWGSKFSEGKRVLLRDALLEA